MNSARRWTKTETASLLGALGADASIESIAARTGHSIKAVRAKLSRLDYSTDEVHGCSMFTVNSLADLVHVTPRQVRRWKERGWLETRGRRITEGCLSEFLRAHPDQIPFDSLRAEARVFLVDLGYPCPERAAFKKNVREILDGIGRQRKPRRPIRRGEAASDAITSHDDPEGEANSARGIASSG